MKRKIIVLLCIGMLTSTSCISQIKLKAIVSFDYSYGITNKSLNTFIEDNNFQGIHFNWRYFLKRDFSLGVDCGWNNFDTELPRSVYETNRGTVSAVQTRYFRSTPIIVTGYYYMRSLHYVMPYIGGGLGPYFVKYEKHYGVVPELESDVRFGLRPEIGFIVPIKNTGLGFILNGRYNKVFYSHEEVKNLNYFEASLGIYFGYPVFEDSFMKD